VGVGGLQHDIPSVRLHFRDDDDRQGQPAQDHQQNVGRFIASADVLSSPIPAGTNYKLAQRALVFQRSHVKNLWHSLGEDSADLYVRMCRWVGYVNSKSNPVCAEQHCGCRRAQGSVAEGLRHVCEAVTSGVHALQVPRHMFVWGSGATAGGAAAVDGWAVG
jgi:hypothetical protein